MIVTTSILVVDDDEHLLDVCATLLRAAGYPVITASDGITAYDLAIASLPALVVLDLDLPGRSGYDVAAMLRSNPTTERIPLIAATGHSHDALHERGRRVAFDVVMMKPYDPTDLIAHIGRLIAAAPPGHRSADDR